MNSCTLRRIGPHITQALRGEFSVQQLGSVGRININNEISTCPWHKSDGFSVAFGIYTGGAVCP